MRVLKYGCKGEDVKWLQLLLNENGIKVAIDGSYGNITRNAVKEYQKSHGLVVDGYCGNATQKSLGMSDFMVTILDPKEYKLWVAGTPYGSPSYPLRTLKQWAELEGADKVWNLAFFVMNDKGKTHDEYGVVKGRTITYVRSKGRDVGYGGTAERLSFDAYNIFAGYKLAVKNGVKKSVSSVGKRARNANGQLKDGRFFVIQSITKQTESALVKYMTDNYKVDTMFIQDAGGSTGYYNANMDVLIACEREGTNGRPVATVVCAKKK